VMDVMGGHLGGQHMGSRPGMPPLLRFQPRMVPVQPMPPSGEWNADRVIFPLTLDG
ncbi:unnamed protein product, partial [Nesidiocoris tenuis]